MATGSAAPGRPPYSMPGVLDYLAKEWRRFEREKASWEAERATLLTRISSLEGDKCQLETLKRDLGKRITMLEYALKRERAKYAQSGEAPKKKNRKIKDATMKLPSRAALAAAAAHSDPHPAYSKERARTARSRQILRQYLEEMGLDDVPSQPPPIPRREPVAQPDALASVADDAATKRPDKEKSKTKGKRKSKRDKEARSEEMELDKSELDDIDIDTSRRDEGGVKHWKPRYTFRSHLDGVRALAFHHEENVLLSASEDCTVKLWSLPSNSTKKSSSHDVEPIYTFRGHTEPVIACVMATDRRVCYTAGADSTVRMWALPSFTCDPYGTGTMHTRCVDTFKEHTDCVWDLKLHPVAGTNLLASCSADTTVKLWDISPERGHAPACKRTLSYKGHVPTSLDFCNGDLKKLVVSYRSSIIVVYDIETGKLVQEVGVPNHDSGPVHTQPNKITCHPTMNYVGAAFEDSFLRFFDLTSGKMVSGQKAHEDGVTCVTFDPAGLFIATGGHDSSLRFWDFSSGKCVQEMAVHRAKFEESIHCIAYHPKMPRLATGGADSNIKIFA